MKRVKLLTTASAVATVILCMQGTSAYAQDKPAVDQSGQVQGDEDVGFAIGEIVVTAQKRSESVDDVPLSIAAFGTKELAARQVGSTDQLTGITPNLQFGTSAPSSGLGSAATIFIRGIGQSDFIPSSDPGVGLYIDGVYIARSVGAATDLLDVERIEVLRGPQGTLFGRNTIGGAISLITARPKFDFGGKFSILGGDDRRFEVRGDINVPLSPQFAVKLNGAVGTRKGYVRNLFSGKLLGGRDNLGLRFAARWEPSTEFSANLSAEYVREKDSGSPTVFAGLNTSGLFARLAAGTSGPPPSVQNFGDRGVADSSGQRQLCSFTNSLGQNIDNSQNIADARIRNTGAEGGIHQIDVILNCGSAGRFDLGATGPFTSFANGNSRSKVKVLGTTLNLENYFGDISLKSITGFRRTSYFVFRDADSTPLTILHSQNDDVIKQFSQELQLVGDGFDGRLEWLLGAYYFNERATFDNPVFLPAITVGALNNAGKLKTTNYAAFSQATFDITDALHFTAGLRYTFEDKRATPNFFAIGNYNVPNPFSTAGFRCGGPGLVIVNDPAQAINRPDAQCIGLTNGQLLYDNVENKLSFSQFTPTANIALDITSDILAYARYARGFKSGGFSTRIIQPVPSAANPDGVSLLPRFTPEIADTYELGIKGTTKAAGGARFSLAVFRTDYQDQQIVVRQGVAPITFNAGKSRIQGVEFEGSWTPTPELYVSAGVGYVDGKYLAFDGPLQALLNAAQAQFNGSPTTFLPPEQRGGLVDLSDKLAYTPKWSANGGISYRIETGGEGFVLLHGDWTYQSRIFFDAPNSREISQSGYNVFNGNITWTLPNGKSEFAFGVKNIGNKLYRTAGNISFSGSAYAESIYNRGREWTLKYKQSF
jgi:iron complex outermembrane receptor protein